ncbi:MAG: hypothetical protein JSS53_04885, partial [Proteobacteria bacterium]|nr:hypothetical protein [Pseudomonadota bacterium]
MLKNLLIGNLLAAVGKLTDHGFERDLKRLRYKAGEDAQKLPNIPNTPTNLSDITLGLEQYKCIIQTAQNMTPLAPRKLPKPIDYSREFVRTIVWTLGALLVTIGISGFAGSEYNLTERMLDSRVAAILITLLPVLITAIMVAYYGGKAFQRPFDTATALITRNTAMPVAFRLYPKAFLFLQFLNVFVFSPFSSGPATELVYTNIPESWGIGREFLAQTAFWGVIVYCIINLNDILCSGIMHYASQFGGQYTRMMAVLIERATAFCLAINMMDGNALEETLKQLPDDTKKLLLGIDLNRFSKICDHTGNLKESLAQGGWLLWKKPTADDIDALQNLNTFSNNL